MIATLLWCSSATTSYAQDPHHDAAPAAAVAVPRSASGTSWLPSVTPVYAIHRDVGQWNLMFHGNAFAQFLYESGAEHHGGHQVGSINWLMAMADRSLASGRVTVRAMASLEPWTIGGCGYPNLVATGEICRGDTIHDRQHPHDVFMELAAAYEGPLRGSLRWQLYAGPAGEPALGPTSFPHRLSAAFNPIAPIAHHWLDSTHITFGVMTAGLYHRRWKVEASVFNGREPDERRANVDLGPLDSMSTRVSFAPSETLTLQVSTGHLEEAEAGVGEHPEATDVDRLTASAAYHRRISERTLWASTVAYGTNSGAIVTPTGNFERTTNALLIESTVLVADRHAWFGRAELVAKPAHDLHAHEFGAAVFTVGKIQGGYVRDGASRKGLVLGIGGAVSLTLVPKTLAPRYEGRVAPGFGVFLAIRPAEAMAAHVH